MSIRTVGFAVPSFPRSAFTKSIQSGWLSTSTTSLFLERKHISMHLKLLEPMSDSIQFHQPIFEAITRFLSYLADELIFSMFHQRVGHESCVALSIFAKYSSNCLGFCTIEVSFHWFCSFCLLIRMRSQRDRELQFERRWCEGWCALVFWGRHSGECERSRRTRQSAKSGVCEEQRKTRCNHNRPS